MTKLRAVFFDVGGTLLQPYRSLGHLYSAVLSGFGRSLAPADLQIEFERSFARATERLDGLGVSRYARSETGYWRELLGEVLGALGEPPPRDAEVAALRHAMESPASYEVFADTRPTLEALTERGLTLGVISNWDSGLGGILDELALGDFFAVIVTAGEEGVEKPSPAIFARACARLGVAAASSLHVGDAVREDFEGARAAGLAALLLDRSGSRRGDGVIHDLSGILGRLGEDSEPRRNEA